MKHIKQCNFDDQPAAIITNATIAEKRLRAGDSVEVRLIVNLSVSHDCVITLEAMTKAKHAYYKALKRELDKQHD